MMREASFWTAEKDAAAQALWRQGLSGRDVARRIGAPSSGAVIGRMWRLGFKRPAQVARVNQYAGMGVRRAVADIPWPKRTFSRRGAWPKVAERPLPQQTPVLCSPRPWLSREDNECAYPVAGEGAMVLSCCNRATRSGYCQAHRNAIVGRPPGLSMEEELVDVLAG